MGAYAALGWSPVGEVAAESLICAEAVPCGRRKNAEPGTVAVNTGEDKDETGEVEGKEGEEDEEKE